MGYLFSIENERICSVFAIADFLVLTTRYCAILADTRKAYININNKKYDIDVIRESTDSQLEQNFDIAAIKVSFLNNSETL